RSDRGGEYTRQDFLDHLKDHGITAHRNPPYTPQHNGVSERRNRTLLDMVRSMMSQTTLPKSFWDYALETAARILNMVRTKNVEKTPYEFEKWLNAMNVEMQSMKDNEVWVLVELPPNGKTVHSKWLFKKKTDMDGNVHIYKARLVAKGYTQTLGIDYEETFSPVADIRAIRILIAIATKFISGLSVVPTIKEPISMYCDNTGAIAIANESGITKGARHFHAKVHYLREVIEFGDIKLEKVHTYDNLADLFTKALSFPKHSEHTRNIGMLPASSLM
nr:retrotransposon protein, putative, Ty1-copia subclass [Tanacetum cinerariifolium]